MMRWSIAVIIVLLMLVALSGLDYLPRSVGELAMETLAWVPFAAFIYLCRRMSKRILRKEMELAPELAAEYLDCPEPDFLEQFRSPPWRPWAPGRHAEFRAFRLYFGRRRSPQFCIFDLGYRKIVGWNERFTVVTFVVVPLTFTRAVNRMPSVPNGYTACPSNDGFLYFYRSTSRFAKGDTLDLESIPVALNHALDFAAALERINRVG